MKNIIIATLLSVFTLPALAASDSPYTGQETRDIKALSQHEITGYLNGNGLGYAKAAELNQYPGPKHVLELSKELDLSEEQIKQSQHIFDQMKVYAVALGEQFIAKEQELDQRFSDNNIDDESLALLLSEIGALKTKLRYVHLKSHLEQKSVLTKHQVQLYDQLRGYGKAANNKHHHGR
jgi:Spy/CpxP family protein refolding chaperone